MIIFRLKFQNTIYRKYMIILMLVYKSLMHSPVIQIIYFLPYSCLFPLRPHYI
eukprot:UN05823